MTYETILSCPDCGKEVPLVATDVVAERDRLHQQVEAQARVIEAAWRYFYSMTSENYVALGAALRAAGGETETPPEPADG